MSFVVPSGSQSKASPVMCYLHLQNICSMFLVFTVFYFLFFNFLRCSLMVPILPSDSLCLHGWPWTHDPLASPVQVLGLQLCTHVPSSFARLKTFRVAEFREFLCPHYQFFLRIHALQMFFLVSTLFLHPLNKKMNSRAIERVQWVWVLATQASWPGFDPWHPCKGGRRELAPQSCPLHHASFVACVSPSLCT